MFLVFGFKTSDRRLGSQVRRCEVCAVPILQFPGADVRDVAWDVQDRRGAGVTAAQVLIRRTTKFSLFFIPLFPVKPATYYLQCTNCGAVRRTDRRAALAG